MSEIYGAGGVWMAEIRATYTVNLVISPTGAGQIEITIPASGGTVYTCPTSCSHTVMAGTAVKVHAIAYSTPIQYVFTGWSSSPSGVCSGTSDCTFTPTANTTITANFVQATGSIGEIAGTPSVNHGPWTRGQNATIVSSITCQNTGYTLDTVYRRYLYKGTDNLWHEICTKQAAIAAGGSATYTNEQCTIPSAIQTCAIGSQCVNLCVKVYGTYDGEPADPALGFSGLSEDGRVFVFEAFPSLELDAASLILGGIGATALLALMYGQFWKK